MINLLDYITEDDKQRIKNYIYKNGIQKEHFCGLETYLTEWAKNKKKLFHLLNGNLRHVITGCTWKKPYSDTSNELINIMNHSDCNFISHYEEFIWDVIQNILKQEYFSENPEIKIEYDTGDFNSSSWSQSRKWEEFSWQFKSKPCNIDAFIDDKIAIYDQGRIKIIDKRKKPSTLQITYGMKPIKALQKILSFFDAPESLLKEFEEFKRLHSIVFNTKTITGNLVISIHPLDYMTMSDNGSGWQSCMSWEDDGCFRLGTVEMMNSNNAVVCYLEAKEPYHFHRKADEGDPLYVWNNKKFRQLAYVHKDIILMGKPYPYDHMEITEQLLGELRKLAEVQLNWTYEFGPERYNDMRHIYSLTAMENNKNWLRLGQSTKHNILVDTRAMYNDMLNDNINKNYICVRNKVKKMLILSLSGKAPCLCCGENKVREENYCNEDYDYNAVWSHANRLVCESCTEEYFRCDVCDCASPRYPVISEVKTSNYFWGSRRRIKVCESCLQNKGFYCACCGSLTYYSGNRHSDQDIIIDTRTEERKKKEPNPTLTDLQDIKHLRVLDDSCEEQGVYQMFMCLDCADRMVEEGRMIKYEPKDDYKGYVWSMHRADRVYKAIGPLKDWYKYTYGYTKFFQSES